MVLNSRWCFALYLLKGLMTIICNRTPHVRYGIRDSAEAAIQVFQLAIRNVVWELSEVIQFSHQVWVDADSSHGNWIPVGIKMGSN